MYLPSARILTWAGLPVVALAARVVVGHRLLPALVAEHADAVGAPVDSRALPIHLSLGPAVQHERGAVARLAVDHVDLDGELVREHFRQGNREFAGRGGPDPALPIQLDDLHVPAVELQPLGKVADLVLGVVVVVEHPVAGHEVVVEPEFGRPGPFGRRAGGGSTFRRRRRRPPASAAPPSAGAAAASPVTASMASPSLVVTFSTALSSAVLLMASLSFFPNWALASCGEARSRAASTKADHFNSGTWARIATSLAESVGYAP